MQENNSTRTIARYLLQENDSTRTIAQSLMQEHYANSPWRSATTIYPQHDTH
jgi:hypothetical protein